MHGRRNSDQSLSDFSEGDEAVQDYEYHELSTRNSIRLLKLHPSDQKESELVCELLEQSLSGKTEYEAVSWSWGDEPWNSKINIREGDMTFNFCVPESLVSALLALRRRRKARVLWIDAICINQDEPTEKNFQVPMMADIYGFARKVCIWIGEADKDSKIALDFIKEEVLKLQDFDELCDKPEASPKWRAMLNLMKRPWFSRRWVVQEIALANDAFIYCGADTIPWKDFADAVQLFVEVETATHRLSDVMKKDPKFYHVPGWFEYVSALGASLLVNATSTLFRITKDKKRQPLLSLEYLVSNLSVFQASQPRDTIYALLAIAKDTTPYAAENTRASSYVPGQMQLAAWANRHTQAKRYKVDYKQPYVDVCKEFISFAIRQSDPTRALDIICRPWAPVPVQRDRNRTGRGRSKDGIYRRDTEELDEPPEMPMPSWIPQLSNAAYSMYKHANNEYKMGRKNADPLVSLPTHGQKNYSAAETKAVNMNVLKFKKREKYYSMYVSGFVLDSVERVEVPSQAGNIPEEWVRSVGWKANEGEVPPDLWRTLVADRGQHGRNPPTYYARACQDSLTRGLDSGSINTTELINEGRCSVIAEFCRRVQAVIWNRRLMKTKSGNYGLVRKDVQNGDLVCILYGCSVPVILRRRTKTQRDKLKEQEEDAQEQKEAALLILRAFRASKARRARVEKSPRSPQTLPSPSTPSRSQESAMPFVTLPSNSGKQTFREKPPAPPIKPKPQLAERTNVHQVAADNKDGARDMRLGADVDYFYEFVGECYVHGMMDGEAIEHQNQHVIKAQVFELR